MSAKTYVFLRLPMYHEKASFYLSCYCIATDVDLLCKLLVRSSLDIGRRQEEARQELCFGAVTLKNIAQHVPEPVPHISSAFVCCSKRLRLHMDMHAPPGSELALALVAAQKASQVHVLHHGGSCRLLGGSG